MTPSYTPLAMATLFRRAHAPFRHAVGRGGHLPDTLLRRHLHVTKRNESTIVIAGLSVAALATGVNYAMRAAEQMRAQQRAEDEANGKTAESENAAPPPGADVPPPGADAGAGAGSGGSSGSPAWTWASVEAELEAMYQRASNLSLEEMQANLSKSMSGRNFYHGGFEDKMTRREAALTLGVRESASAERIKEAHRRILRINHPDMGGSTYLAFKVNEAKELLIKGKD